MTTETSSDTDNSKEDNDNKDSEDEYETRKSSKKRKYPKRLDPVLASPISNWRSPCGLGASKRSRESLTSILAGLTKRDEELEEKAKEWEQEKIETTKKLKEEATIVVETRSVGRTVHENDEEEGEDPCSLVEELFEDADTVVLFTKRLFLKNLYQHAQETERKQHAQYQQQQRSKMNKMNHSFTPSHPPTIKNEQKVSPDKISVLQAFQQQFLRAAQASVHPSVPSPDTTKK